VNKVRLGRKARHCLRWMADHAGWVSAITMAREYEDGALAADEDRHIIRGRRGRLVRAGYVEVEVRDEGGREVWYYRVTYEGHLALRGLGPPQLRLLAPRRRPPRQPRRAA